MIRVVFGLDLVWAWWARWVGRDLVHDVVLPVFNSSGCLHSRFVCIAVFLRWIFFIMW